MISATGPYGPWDSRDRGTTVRSSAELPEDRVAGNRRDGWWGGTGWSGLHDVSGVSRCPRVGSPSTPNRHCRQCVKMAESPCDAMETTSGRPQRARMTDSFYSMSGGACREV